MNFSQAFRILASSSSYLVPGDFRHKELLVEACYALSNLPSMLHMRGDWSTRWESIIAQWMSNFEVVLELFAGGFRSDEFRNLLVTLVEFAKAVCRLRLLLTSHKPVMLVQWNVHSEALLDTDHYVLHYRNQRCFTRNPMPAKASPQPILGRRSGLVIHASAALCKVDAMHGDPSLVRTSSKEGMSEDTEAQEATESVLAPLCSEKRRHAEELLTVAEAMYIVRPVVQALFARKAKQSSPASSSALEILSCFLLSQLLPLSMEVASIQMSARALAELQEVAQQDASGSASHSSHHRPHDFDRELQRRRLYVLLCLIRSPLFDRATLPVLRRMEGVLRRLPLLGGVAKELIDALKYLNGIHFYTANS